MIINRMAGGGAAGGLPNFTYSGTYTLLDDGNKNWRIKFLTSGTLTFTKLDGNIDLCLVGGGGGGYKYTYNSEGGGGGGGGYTRTSVVSFVALNTEYSIVVGAGGAASAAGNSAPSGGASSAFGLAANGGVGGSYHTGGDGGSGGGASVGGTGGTNGSDGTTVNSWIAGTGQGTTTYEFGDTMSTLYSTGGDGKTGSVSGAIKTANTGDGGDGTVNGTATAGASGIVVIRNHRAA